MATTFTMALMILLTMARAMGKIEQSKHGNLNDRRRRSYFVSVQKCYNIHGHCRDTDYNTGIKETD